ncbi:sucrose synthase [Tanacetum coccineum]
MKKMYELIENYKLNGQFRWISSQMNRVRNGELYRVIADTRGAFIQPAFYEAFGLTVVEAMTCGLPTFATLHGGPAEIIVHGKSGFHIDPYHGDQVSELLVNFFEKTKQDPSHWDAISKGGLQRIQEKYTWQIYSERLLTLAGVYGFWKHVSKLDRLEIRRYLEMFYALKYRQLLLTSKINKQLNQAGEVFKVASIIAEVSGVQKEILDVVQEEGNTWMTPIREYLTKEILPEDKKKARAVRRKAVRFGIYQEKSYLTWKSTSREIHSKDGRELLCIRQCLPL